MAFYTGSCVRTLSQDHLGLVLFTSLMFSTFSLSLTLSLLKWSHHVTPTRTLHIGVLVTHTRYW